MDRAEASNKPPDKGAGQSHAGISSRVGPSGGKFIEDFEREQGSLNGHGKGRTRKFSKNSELSGGGYACTPVPTGGSVASSTQKKPLKQRISEKFSALSKSSTNVSLEDQQRREELNIKLHAEEADKIRAKMRLLASQDPDLEAVFNRGMAIQMASRIEFIPVGNPRSQATEVSEHSLLRPKGELSTSTTALPKPGGSSLNRHTSLRSKCILDTLPSAADHSRIYDFREVLRNNNHGWLAKFLPLRPAHLCGYAPIWDTMPSPGVLPNPYNTNNAPNSREDCWNGSRSAQELGVQYSPSFILSNPYAQKHETVDEIVAGASARTGQRGNEARMLGTSAPTSSRAEATWHTRARTQRSHTENNAHMPTQQALVRQVSSGNAVSRRLFNSTDYRQPSAQTALPSTSMLPTGWLAAVEQATGRTYFVNLLTKECQWESPVRSSAEVPGPVIPPRTSSQTAATASASDANARVSQAAPQYGSVVPPLRIGKNSDATDKKSAQLSSRISDSKTPSSTIASMAARSATEEVRIMQEFARRQHLALQYVERRFLMPIVGEESEGIDLPSLTHLYSHRFASCRSSTENAFIATGVSLTGNELILSSEDVPFLSSSRSLERRESYESLGSICSSALMDTPELSEDADFSFVNAQQDVHPIGNSFHLADDLFKLSNSAATPLDSHSEQVVTQQSTSARPPSSVYDDNSDAAFKSSEQHEYGPFLRRSRIHSSVSQAHRQVERPDSRRSGRDSPTVMFRLRIPSDERTVDLMGDDGANQEARATVPESSQGVDLDINISPDQTLQTAFHGGEREAGEQASNIYDDESQDDGQHDDGNHDFTAQRQRHRSITMEELLEPIPDLYESAASPRHMARAKRPDFWHPQLTRDEAFIAVGELRGEIRSRRKKNLKDKIREKFKK